jgi:NAD-dependent deacetylase
MSVSPAVQRLASLLAEARNAVVFTGAGISTESGIPDFRSPGGVWDKMKPIEFDAFMRSAAMRREAWRRRFATEDMFATARPNDGHNAVAELVRRGTAQCIITQNIDNLHQASGVPSEKIVELHGNTTYATCLDCANRYEIAALRNFFERDGDVPDCQCGGYIKAATISFGQAMPEEAMQRAAEATLNCDLFLVLGSSLVVYPAAGFPLMAKRNGAKLAILNRSPTDQDDYANLVICEGIGATLSQALAEL